MPGPPPPPPPPGAPVPPTLDETPAEEAKEGEDGEKEEGNQDETAQGSEPNDDDAVLSEKEELNDEDIEALGNQDTDKLNSEMMDARSERGGAATMSRASSILSLAIQEDAQPRFGSSTFSLLALTINQTQLI